MKITVMMAAYNAQRYIPYALTSVLLQQGPMATEIIVFDDGSTDETAAIVADYAKTHGRIELIQSPNRGVAAARNGLLEALGDRDGFATFLDADDLVPQGRYARDMAFFTADPSLALTYGATMMFKAGNAEQTAPALGSDTACGRGVQLAAGTYRTDLLRAVGRFDESFRQAEDMDFLLRMFEMAPKYIVQDEPCLFYRRHGANMTCAQDELRRDFSRALMLSIRRRKAGNLPSYPADLFDSHDFAKAHAW